MLFVCAHWDDLDIVYPLYYDTSMSSQQKRIIDHISRLEGQLASVKLELGKENPDCGRAAQTLQSAARSFAGLREQFVESFLLSHFINESKLKDKTLFAQLLALIKS